MFRERLPSWSTGLEILKRDRDDGVCLCLRGDLIKESVPLLKEAVLDAIEASPLFLDMSEVSHIDSSGLGALISIHKSWTSQSRDLVLVDLSPMSRKFFRTTGLLGHFTYLESERTEA